MTDIMTTTLGEYQALVESQEATITELTDWQEEMREVFSLAIQGDLENGVKWLNEEASKDFARKFPGLCNALELLHEDDTDE